MASSAAEATERAGTGAGADDHTPEQDELPDPGHGEGQQEPTCHQPQRDERHPAQAEAVDQGGRERRHQPEQQQAQRQGGRDLGRGPAELALQRQQQHARRADRTGRDQHGQEGGAGDDPAIVDVLAGEHRGEAGREHAVAPGGRMAARRRRALIMTIIIIDIIHYRNHE
jgi:hypothetical protein